MVVASAGAERRRKGPEGGVAWGGAHMTPQDTTKRQATSALDGTLGRVRVKGEG